METFRHDIRQTIRMMIANKAFTAAALLTLALGIGANAAVFSMVYGVLLRPLPYPEPERIVRLSEYHPGANAPLSAAFLSNYTVDAWLPSTKTLEGIAVYSGNSYTIGRDNPIRLDGASVSPALFRLLRVQPRGGTLLHRGGSRPGRRRRDRHRPLALERTLRRQSQRHRTDARRRWPPAPDRRRRAGRFRVPGSRPRVLAALRDAEAGHRPQTAQHARDDRARPPASRRHGRTGHRRRHRRRAQRDAAVRRRPPLRQGSARHRPRPLLRRRDDPRAQTRARGPDGRGRPGALRRLRQRREPAARARPRPRTRNGRPRRARRAAGAVSRVS